MEITEKVKKDYKFKRIIGVILIIIGFVALITPFTPGSWLIFIGLEFLGLRFLLWKKLFFREKKDDKNFDK